MKFPMVELTNGCEQRRALIFHEIVYYTHFLRFKISVFSGLGGSLKSTITSTEFLNVFSINTYVVIIRDQVFVFRRRVFVESAAAVFFYFLQTTSNGMPSKRFRAQQIRRTDACFVPHFWTRMYIKAHIIILKGCNELPQFSNEL